MNTSIISHRMFVAALANDDVMPAKPARAAQSAVASNSAGKPVTKQLTLEQLAATASRYWSDFPFFAVSERRAEKNARAEFFSSGEKWKHKI